MSKSIVLLPVSMFCSTICVKMFTAERARTERQRCYWLACRGISDRVFASSSRTSSQSYLVVYRWPHRWHSPRALVGVFLSTPWVDIPIVCLARRHFVPPQYSSKDFFVVCLFLMAGILSYPSHLVTQSRHNAVARSASLSWSASVGQARGSFTRLSFHC